MAPLVEEVEDCFREICVHAIYAVDSCKCCCCSICGTQSHAQDPLARTYTDLGAIALAVQKHEATVLKRL